MAADDRRRTLLPYLAGALVLALLALRACGSGGAPETPAVAVDGAGAPPAAGERRPAGEAWVHVAGAVRRPGLYRVRQDARVGAAVEAAGGLARRADLRAVNLAATVRDGQQVVVPARGERPPAGGSPAAGGGASDAGQEPGPAEGAKLSLATATVEQLDELDGIGPTLAKRILEWRDAHGGFDSVEQLREVEGIGDKRFEALQAAVQP